MTCDECTKENNPLVAECNARKCATGSSSPGLAGWKAVEKVAVDVENEWQTIQDHIQDKKPIDAMCYIMQIQKMIGRLYTKLAENR